MAGDRVYPILPLHKTVLVEAIATFCMMYHLCNMDVMMKHISSLTPTQPLAERLSWGLLNIVVIIGAGFIWVVMFGGLSGAHLNPAVTFAFALLGRFPWKEVPHYIFAQISGSVVVSYALRISFYHVGMPYFFGTVPTGSHLQSFVFEFGSSFLLMFVICEVATSYKLVKLRAGLAVGSVRALSTIVAGPISGASMNLARTLGPAIAFGIYEGLWVYVFGSFLGCIFGALAHDRLKRFVRANTQREHVL